MQMLCLFCVFDGGRGCVAIVKIIIFAFQAKVLAKANSSKIIALTKLVRSSIYKTDASKSF
jgi:hypothetical protein